MISKTTDGVLIEVRTKYIPEESHPEAGHFFFAYQIKIQNLNDTKIQLINRHWIIMDQKGNVEEVRGAGVVGKQPELSPNESFEYTSFCPLKTPVGSMRGSYEMIRADGAIFHAEIPEFDLIKPGALGMIH